MPTQTSLPANMVSSPEPSTLEKAFAIFVLIMSTGAFLNVGIGTNWNSLDARPEIQAIWFFFYLTTVPLFLVHCKGFIGWLKREIFLVSFIGLVLASVSWSNEPVVTAKRGVALVLTAMFACYFAVRYPLIQQLRLLASAYGIVAACSIVFELLGLGTNLGQGAPGWIGVYTQKNQLGVNMSMAMAVFWVVRKVDPQSRSWAGLCSLMAFVLLVFSRSAVAVLMLAALIAVVSCRRFLRTGLRKLAFSALAAIAIFIPVALWALQHLDAVTGLLGRDATFSGRGPLWLLCALMALRKPWLGYGYSAFWYGTEGTSIIRSFHWHPSAAHNGFLEIWLALGVVGVALFTITLLIYVKRAVVLAHTADGAEHLWPLLFLALAFVWNLSQPGMIPSHNGFLWIGFVSVGSTSAQLTAKLRLREPDRDHV